MKLSHDGLTGRQQVFLSPVNVSASRTPPHHPHRFGPRVAGWAADPHGELVWLRGRHPRWAFLFNPFSFRWYALGADGRFFTAFTASDLDVAVRDVDRHAR